MSNNSKKITANEVSEEKRFAFLPEFFDDKLMIYGERLVYRWSRCLSSDYEGGLWNFYHLSNGSGYVAPATDRRFTVEVSADGSGVIVTMFALNGLIHEIAARDCCYDALIDRYYALREFAAQHADAVAIYRAID